MGIAVRAASRCVLGLFVASVFCLVFESARGVALAAHTSQSSTPAPTTTDSAAAPAAPTPSQIITAMQPGQSYSVTSSADLGSTATLALSGSTLTVASGATVSMGTLAQQGGTLTVSGTVSAAQGAYLNGSTTLTGTLQSPQTAVGSGGALSGNGTVQGNLVSAGQVNPTGTMTVTGNYTQATGSSLNVGLTPAGQSDTLVVKGAADVSAGRLVLSADKGFYASNMSYNVLNAAGGKTTFNSVQQPFDSLVLQFRQGQNGAVVVSRNYQSVSTGAGASSAGVVLDQANQSASTDMKAIVASLDFSSKTTIDSALSQMSAESQRVTAQTGLNAGSTFSASTKERMEAVRTETNQGSKTSATPSSSSSSSSKSSSPSSSPSSSSSSSSSSSKSNSSEQQQQQQQQSPAQSPAKQIPTPSKDRAMLATSLNAGDQIGDEGSGFAVFARYLGSTGREHGSSDRTGYTYNANGMNFGFDKVIGGNYLVGLNFGYLATNVKIEDVGGSTSTVYSYRVGPYFSYFTEKWHADLSLSYTLNRNLMWRKIVFSDVNRQAKSDYFSNTWQANLGYGYDFAFGSFKIGPTIGVDYTYNRSGTYSESGADSLNQSVKARGVSSLQTAPGVKMSYAFEVRNAVVTPEVRGAWSHEFLDNDRIIESSLQGMPGVTMRTRTAEPIRDMARLGAALTVKSGNLELRGDYEYSARQDMQAHSYTAGVRYSF